MKLSQQKKDKIAEQILSHLFHESPNLFFTAQIAESLARDEEFIKAMLMDLRAKALVVAVRKNPQGKPYSRRIRWRLSNKAHQAYSQHL